MKDLNTILNSIDISADWVGLREVCENKTFRYIRDMNPQSNTRSSSHGIMVEVLSNGQFGYSATSDMSESGINKAAKSALEALTKTLSFQLAKYKVTVNCVSPGYTKKDGKHSALSEQEWKKIESKIPLLRLGKPQDTANLISFLLSDEASYITGQVIKVDGGISLI